MSPLWIHDGSAWGMLAPAGFEDEATLHRLVEEAPHLLPLSGNPRLVVVGREVLLRSGYADLVAVEASGRLAILEVKLAKNQEARRAVVAQVLAYAAVLHGSSLETLESEILGRHLRSRDYTNLAEAAGSEGQEIDSELFNETLAMNLAEGRFRLVFVLDEVPTELVKLVAYLEAIGDKLVIDLVTIAAYEVEGSRILVPQRIAPEHVAVPETRRPSKPTVPSETEGAEAFGKSTETAPPEHRAGLRRTYEWAKNLEAQGLARLVTVHGKNRTILRVYLPDESSGLVTVWNDHGSSISVFRTVFERRAPRSIPVVEEAIAPTPLGQGNTIAYPQLNDRILDVLESAYREAVLGT